MFCSAAIQIWVGSILFSAEIDFQPGIYLSQPDFGFHITISEGFTIPGFKEIAEISKNIRKFQEKSEKFPKISWNFWHHASSTSGTIFIRWFVLSHGVDSTILSICSITTSYWSWMPTPRGDEYFEGYDDTTNEISCQSCSYSSSSNSASSTSCSSWSTLMWCFS